MAAEERGGMESSEPVGGASWTRILRKIDDYRWEIPTTYKPGMRVPGLVFADERMLRQIAEEQALEQVANVATLPGIVGYSYAMPDIHWGYGFPVGGVAAFDLDEGVISPGGVGYDVNCGVRLIRTNLIEEDVRPHLEQLVNILFRAVPSGVGATGSVKLEVSRLDHALPQADPDKLSPQAKSRGKAQVGTLG